MDLTFSKKKITKDRFSRVEAHFYVWSVVLDMCLEIFRDTFPGGVLGKMVYLIVSIPDLCLLTHFSHRGQNITNISFFSFILQLQTSGSERQEISFEDDVEARQVP